MSNTDDQKNYNHIQTISTEKEISLRSLQYKTPSEANNTKIRQAGGGFGYFVRIEGSLHSKFPVPHGALKSDVVCSSSNTVQMIIC